MEEPLTHHVFFRIGGPARVRFGNIHPFVHRGEQSEHIHGLLHEHIENLEDEMAPLFLHTQGVDDLPVQEFGHVHLLVVKVRGKIEPPVRGDEVHRRPVHLMDIDEIVEGQDVPGLIQAGFDMHILVLLEEML